MNVASVLGLIVALFEQVGALQAENEALRAQLAARENQQQS
jgi:hypothetical protein